MLCENLTLDVPRALYLLFQTALEENENVHAFAILYFTVIIIILNT